MSPDVPTSVELRGKLPATFTGRWTSFRAEWQYGGGEAGTAEVTTEAESLYDVIRSFESFLRACGFEFDGRVTLLEPDEDVVV